MKKQIHQSFELLLGFELLLAILMLSLVPAESWGGKKPKQASPSALETSSPVHEKLDKRSLSLDELDKLIDGFEATLEKSDKGDKGKSTRSKKELSRAIIYGQVFPDCVGYLEPVVHSNPSDGKGNCANTVGFEFLDIGGKFKECVEKHHKKKESCETLKCISLSEYEDKNYSFPLQENYENHVSFKHMFTNNSKDIRSKDRFQCEDFNEAPLTHESARVKDTAQKQEALEKEKTKQAEQDAKQAEREAKELELREKKGLEHTENIETLKKQICVDCKSHKELEDAIEANEKLRSMQEIGAKLGIVTLNKGDFEKNKKQFHEAELKLLLAETATVSPEQVGFLGEKLLEWAKTHPKDAEKIAISGFRALGERILTDPHATPHTFELASEMFENAKRYAANSKAKAELSKKIEELKIQRLLSMAQFGHHNNPYNLQGEYERALRESEQQSWRVCSSNPGSDACAEILKFRNIVKNLPHIADAADHQKMQAEAGLQQALHPEHYGLPQGPNPAMPGMQPPMNPNQPNPALPIHPAAPINPGMYGAQYGNPMYGNPTYGNPMYGNQGYNPANPWNLGGAYSPQMQQMNPALMGGYNQNSMMYGGYNQLGGYQNSLMNPAMNPAMMGGYNQNSMMYNGYNPMGGYQNHMTTPGMMGGYNSMMPMGH